MGAKTCFLAYVAGDAREQLRSIPAPDREASAEVARALFPNETLEPLADGELSRTNVPDEEILVGVFPGVTIVAAREVGLDAPSMLDQRFLDYASGRSIVLHVMHSVVDLFAFAVWRDGVLQRALSLTSDDGIIEEVGERLPFERSYWDGAHPPFEPGEEDPDYPLPFHPLELGEAALGEFFGFQIEGTYEAMLFDPERIALLRFKRVKPSWWKFWK